MSKYPAFVGPSYVSRSPFGLVERCVNWHPQPLQLPGAKNSFALYPTPGLSTLAASTEAPGRGMFAEDGRAFPMIGQRFYELNYPSFTLTSRGVMARDDNPAGAITNGDGGGQVLVWSGDRADLFDLATNVYTPGVVASGATMGGLIDGFFVLFDTHQSLIKISKNLDGTVWDPTQFAQRSAASDRWKSMLIRYPTIYLFGDTSTDPWYNAGTFPFPLAPIQGAQIQEGIAAAFSAANLRLGPVWLAKSKGGAGYIVQANGYRATKVSTEGVDYAISTYSRIDDAVAFSYVDLDREFYEINFPTAGHTWVWDSALGAFGWHERGHWNPARSMYEAWGPQYHAFEFNKHLVTDLRTGNVNEMSSRFYTDAGDPLRRLRMAPALSGGLKTRMFYDALRLAVEPGIGLAVGQGSDPAVSMRYSNTFGKTWSSERVRRAGKQGEFNHLTEWLKCGSTTGLRVFEISVSDPVPWMVIDAEIVARPGGAARAA